jgi:two-component system cell cycle sensor histidine kinase/response regulator CckA
MRDEDKTKGQLIDELVELRQRVTELEASETERKRAEEALRESEKMYRSVIENIQDVFYRSDLRGWLLMGSPSGAKMFGYDTVDEMIGMSLDSFWPDPKERERLLAQVKASGSVKDYEAVLRRKDGTTFNASFTTHFYYDDHGNLLGTEGIIRDITERKRAEEALRESEELIRGIVEHTPVGILYLEADGTIVYENPAMRRMMGVPEDSPSPVVGRRIQDLPPIQEADVVLLLERLLRGESIAGERAHYRSLLGVEIDVELYAAPRLDSRGDVAGAVVMCANVTGQVRAEAALRESEERYRTLVAQAPIGIITCDRQGDITGLNPAVLQIYGSPDEEAIRSFNILTAPSLVKAGISGDIRRCMEEDTLVVSERSYRFPWGKEITARVRLVPLKDERGEISGALATAEDITEQRTLEAQLRQAQKLEAVGTLAGGIAHEFNNLLTGIIGNLSLALAEVEPGSQAHQDLRSVERSARRAAALTRQLLALSRKPRAERLRRLSLNPVVEEVVNLLCQTIDRRIEINTYPTAGLWPVEADSNQMSQVVMNLCLNARDAIMEYLQGERPLPERPADEPLAIVVEAENVTLDEEYCRTHLEARPGQYVCLTVSDNGCGMDAETQTRVFEPFFTTKEVGQGTGLGLAMVHSIVKGHDGFINLYSEPGVGSTFKVYLPRAREQTVSGAEAAMEPAAPPTGSETVLLVDDDEAVLKTGQRILESLGYTVLPAGDGREALQVYGRERARIDLVLLDLTMPRMSGLETLHELLQLDPRAKVILASGYSANGPGRAALAEGAAAFVQKPYDLHELALAVRAVLDD